MNNEAVVAVQANGAKAHVPSQNLTLQLTAEQTEQVNFVFAYAGKKRGERAKAKSATEFASAIFAGALKLAADQAAKAMEAKMQETLRILGTRGISEVEGRKLLGLGVN